MGVPCDSATENCGYMVKENQMYIGGHIGWYMTAMLNMFVPFLAYFMYKRPYFIAEDTNMTNHYFVSGWKWMAYGMFFCYLLETLIWPFTFYFNNKVAISYLQFWSWFGTFGAIAVDIGVITMFSKAIRAIDKYGHTGVSKEEAGATLGIFLAFETLLGVLAFIFMYDSVLFMMPRTMKAYFDEKGTAYKFGVEYDM